MFDEYAKIFKVLSDPNRIKIIELLIQGETCGCTLVDKLPISQPTLSHHLKKMAEVGLVRSIKDGNRINYFVNKDKLNEIADFIKELRDISIETCDTKGEI